MDEEIKRLLYLSSIDGFKLLEKEEKMLEEWKANQKEVKVKKPAEKESEESGIGSAGKITVKNVVEKKTK